TEPRLLKQWLGKAGEQLWRSANGLDQEPVRLFDDRPDPKSVSRGVTYARDLASLEEARQALLPLADEVSAHLRKYQKRGQVIQLSIKSPDLRVIQRQTRLPHPSNLQRELAEGAVALLKANWPLSPFSPIRALTLGVSDLSNEADINEQISLFDTAEMFDQRRRQEKLAHTLDALRDKLGSDVIALGYAAKNPKNKQEPSDEP
ncbi:MAG: hypothetical protein IJ240_07535, partial [Clostridia bacterium]|nr:hypothetical protein [Clostridia bacterium]